MERITSGGGEIIEDLLLRRTGAGCLLRFEKLKSNYNYRSPVLLPRRIPLLHLLVSCTLSTLLKNIRNGVVYFNSLTTIPIEL